MALGAMESGDASEVIDRRHLHRMTSGDRGLEQEVLRLFDRQAGLLIARMRDSDARAIGALAHTLKGSAVGIGAGEVASAAETAERVAAGSSGPDARDIRQAIDRLAEAVEAARALIAAMLAEA